MMSATRTLELDVFEAAGALFLELVEALRSTEGRAMDLTQLEKLLQEGGQELLRKLLQGHLELRAQDTVAEPVVGDDGVERTDRHRRTRKIETVFGEVEVERERFQETGLSGRAPVDGALNLPPERMSLSVRRRIAEESAQGAYEGVVERLRSTSGAQVAKRQAQEAVERAAVDFEEFYRARREAETSPEVSEASGSILVITCDGKGVPMRKDSLRENTRKLAEGSEPKLRTRRSKGEKAHRKRMATVAAVYTIAPFERTPEDVMSALRFSEQTVPPAPERPKPEHKRVWASIKEPVEHVVHELFAEAMDRGTKHRQLVALVDGNEVQLGDILVTAEEYDLPITVIIDFIHVLEYLWRAGTAFHREGTRELEAWVHERMLRVLHGGASSVAGAIRRSATRRKLALDKRAAVDVCANYLIKYKAFMRYDEYLKAGYPIATGVIEGACRYLVKDRMEITGARWSLAGAEAILRLRSLRASGDFDEYWAFHEQQEHQRHHASTYENGQVPDLRSTSESPHGHLKLVK